MSIQGYIHLHVKAQAIQNVFVHLTGINLQGEYMLHVNSKDVKLYTLEEFQEMHPSNGDELGIAPYKAVFDLGEDTIHALLIIDKSKKKD